MQAHFLAKKSLGIDDLRRLKGRNFLHITRLYATQMKPTKGLSHSRWTNMYQHISSVYSGPESNPRKVSDFALFVYKNCKS